MDSLNLAQNILVKMIMTSTIMYYILVHPTNEAKGGTRCVQAKKKPAPFFHFIFIFLIHVSHMLKKMLLK